MQLEGPHLDKAHAVRVPAFLNAAACHLRLGDNNAAIGACSEALAMEPSSFCYGATLLMGPGVKPKEKRERLKANVVHLAQRLSKEALHAHVRYIVLEVMGNRLSDMEDVDLPRIRYRLGAGEVAEADAVGVAAGVQPPSAPAYPA